MVQIAVIPSTFSQTVRQSVLLFIANYGIIFTHKEMWCRGIRGATVVAANTRDDILAATQELLQKIIESNQIDKDLVACAFFTTTSDLNAEFPAVAARRLGWTGMALLCGQEMKVPDSLAKCLRILILYNTDKKAEEMVHVYINGAEVLRQEREK